MAQHLNIEGQASGFEIYLDEGLRQELLNGNQTATKNFWDFALDNQKTDNLSENHVSWLETFDIKRHELADNADAVVDKIFNFVKPETGSILEDVLLFQQTASVELLRATIKGFIDVIRVGDRLDEIWDDATGAWKDVNDGNLSEAGKKLLSVGGNSFVELMRVMDLALIGGGVRSVLSSGARALETGIADFVGTLLRSADPTDATRLSTLFKNSFFKNQWLKEVDSVHDFRRAVGKYVDYEEVKGIKFSRDAVEVNKTYPSHWDPLPHKPGAPVTEYVRSGSDISSEQFVRVHTDTNAARPWIIKKSDFEALKIEALNTNKDLAALLQERLALPKKPTMMSDFVPPPDKTLAIRESTVNPLSTDKPDQIQFEILQEGEELLEAWFKHRTNL